MIEFSTLVAQGQAWLFIPSAIVLGALHGLEPGHSKTMMAAFIVAIRGTVKQAVIEFFHNGGRVATHERKYQRSGHVTLTTHIPKAHQHYAVQSSEHLLQWAQRVGRSTFEVVSHQLESRPHPEAGYRSCLGLQRLARSYSEERLEATCQRAIYINSRSYTSISSILKSLVMKADAALPIEQIECTNFSCQTVSTQPARPK
jgi:hypothetical protein